MKYDVAIEILEGTMKTYDNGTIKQRMQKKGRKTCKEMIWNFTFGSQN